MSILYRKNGHFLALPLISPEPMIIERQIIPHSIALVGGSKGIGEQLCTSFWGCHATSSLKSVFLIESLRDHC